MGKRGIRMNGLKVFLTGAAMALVVAQVSFADAPELCVFTGTGVCAASGADSSGIVSGAGGSVTYSNADLGGWTISIVFGESNSPAIKPFGLDITSLSAACSDSHGCSALNLELSDINFTTPSVTFTNSYSLTTASGAASTSQSAWDDPSNSFFGMAHAIGTVGPLTGVGGGSVSGGGPETASPYSLTIDDTFAGCGGASCVFYSSDGALTGGVPEPAAVALFGTVLALCASKLRRRRVA
jgi:hypothetical protein